MTTDPPEPQKIITERLNDCVVFDDKSGSPKGINYDLTARWILMHNHAKSTERKAIQLSDSLKINVKHPLMAMLPSSI